MRSMTGFGVGRHALPPTGSLSVEIRTVNHRYLDVRVRLPSELEGAGMLVEQGVRSRLSRGRCDVSVFCEGGVSPLRLDAERAERAYTDLCALRDKLSPNAEVPLSLLSVVPQLFVSGNASTREGLHMALESALSVAIDELEASREREGTRLQGQLRQHGERIASLVQAIGKRRDACIEGYRTRLSQRLSQLLGERSGGLDERRLEQEVALIVDRSDVTEELSRLRIHLEALDEMQRESGPVGRKIDFLLQEVGRELNTIGSKAQDATIARAVVEAKAELEKLREQVQNVE